MSDIGPALPPHLLAKRKRQQEEAEKAAAAAASAAPKESEGKTSQETVAVVSAATAPKNDVDENPEKRRRVMGPYMPAPIDQMPSRGPNEDDDTKGETNQDEDDSSSDDEIGPSLPGARGSAADEEAAAQRRLASRVQTAEDKITRDEWMLVPPEHGDWTSKVDPTKIRSRKFQTGKGARAPTAKSGDNSLWMETAADKAKRVADEVMGVRRPANETGEDEDPKAKAARIEAQETQRRIDEYNTKNRGKSLMDEHSKSKDRKEEDDPSKRAFDREKDIVGSSKKIGLQQKKQMLERAADFGSRFSKGNYL
ncbi:hypothetical protein TWF173_000515 [Orbilia oligospora]|uniref:DUF3752 domain-containing protein n=2 Tax=Orbilia oligospora TaxID=2813651 RepID=A0A7C8RBR8_ORBOL|nr:hypothetical protein TWF970_006027 [Orbilia oligospora]KAF3317272.1 hypothetical protein TWF173_000515 [Orbilia oligospora]